MKIRLLLFVLLICCFGCSSVSSKKLSDFQIESPKYSPAEPELWQMENGIQVAFIEDHELPLVRATFYYSGGVLSQRPDELGVASMVGEQMREGGAGKYSPDELNLVLEKLSASISSSAGDEYGTVSFRALSSDFETILPLFADVVQRPRFDQRRLAIAKGQARESILRRRDDPATIAWIGYIQNAFAGTPYGWIKGEQDVQRITRDTLIKFYTRVVGPRDAVLAISGDISIERLKDQLNLTFGSWNPKNVERFVPPLGEVKASPGIYFVPTQFNQTSITMGQVGPKRLEPDWYAVDVLNDIFGAEGFGVSRLFQKVRTQLGLAYSVYGNSYPGPVIGKNVIGLQTKSSSTADALVATLEVLQELQEEPVSDAELEVANRVVSNSFVFQFESPYGVVQRWAVLKMLDYPEDYDSLYLKRRSEVSAKDVLEAANTRWDISKFVVIVVGNDEARSSLEELMKNPPSVLSGMTISYADFDEILHVK